MADQVRLKSLTVFASDRITVFAEGASEGTKGGAVVSGQEFETDLLHARDLVRLGSAVPTNPADLNGEVGPLEAHYSVSASDWKRYQAADDAAAKQIEAIRERVNQVAADADAEIEERLHRLEVERDSADREIAMQIAGVDVHREECMRQIADFDARVDAARRAAEAAEAAAVPKTSEGDEPPAEADETSVTAPAAKTSKKST